MKCDLGGKVSLVTGAARGIGQAIADRLAANGSRVVYTDVEEAGAAEAAKRSPGSLGLRMDVTRDEGKQVLGRPTDHLVVTENGRPIIDAMVTRSVPGSRVLRTTTACRRFPCGS